jgi:hypothetical protein
MHETAAANAESAISTNENRIAKNCTVLIIVASQEVALVMSITNYEAD